MAIHCLGETNFQVFIVAFWNCFKSNLIFKLYVIVKTAAFALELITLLNATILLFQSRAVLPFPGLKIALIQY